MRATVSEKTRKLESTVAAIQQKHGAAAVRRGFAEQARGERAPSHGISTGFPQLDRITGCGGIPPGAISLLSGPSTSGKGTLACKLLANAQGPYGAVALLDLRHTADPDYLHRCGVDLARLLVVRPRRAEESTPLLLDVVKAERVRCVVVNGLWELTADAARQRQFHGALGRLRQVARAANCAVVLIAEPSPRWRRWLNLDDAAAERQQAALHLDLQRENWLYRDDELVGYTARAQVLRSLWCWGTPAATIAIEFNGTVRARDRW